MNSNKLITAFCTLLLLCSTAVMAQQDKDHSYGDSTIFIKTNLAAALWGNINVAGEIQLTQDFEGFPLTLHVPVSYNPFTYSNNVKLKHIAFQPELRMWLDQSFKDFYVGIHTHYAYYNVGGISGFSRQLKQHRYQGNLFGVGVSGGYKHMLNDRFGLEASLGLGYARMNYDEFRCAECGTKTGEGHKNYFGLTKAAISLVYMITW